MKPVIRFSMKNAVAIILLIAMTIAGGIMSLQRMNIEQFPNVDIPYLSVFLLYPGASAEQVINDVGKPLEAQFKNLDGVKNIYARGFANGFFATVEFDMDIKLDDAEQSMRDMISQVKLPETVNPPEFYRESPTGNPAVYTVGIYAEADQENVQQYVKVSLIPQLEGIKGIEKIDLSGVAEKKVYVQVRPDDLKEYNLTIDQVKQAILANNLSVPTGEITLADQLLPIRVSKKLSSMEDIENINLLVVKQDMSSLTNAFETIGDGMEQLGDGIEAVGGAVGKMGELQGYQQAQIQLLIAIQGLSSQLIGDQIAYQQMLEKEESNPSSVPPEQMQASLKKIQATEQQIIQLQQKFQETSNQITNISEQLARENNDSPAESNNNTGTYIENIAPNIKIESIKLSEIADISFAAEQENNYTRINGKPGVIFSIIPEGGQNVVAIVKEVEQVLRTNPLPAGYQSEILRDQSIQIEESVYGMLREAFLGAVMAVVVTLLFLRNLRSTIIAIISIPLSIMASFLVLNYLGYTLNLLTLSGIAVAVGRVVDDSIVVIENVFRRIRKSKERNSELVEASTHEVASAITSSTITTVAVFLPLAFVDGIVGKFFAPLAWTIVISLLFSLLVAITVVPLFSRIFLLKLKPVEHQENKMQQIYRKTLQWTLGHRLITLAIALLLLVGSIALLVPNLGFNFLPQEKITNYTVDIEMPVASSPQAADQIARKVENILLTQNEVELVSTVVSGDAGNANVSFVVKDDVKDLDSLSAQLRADFANIIGAKNITLVGIGGIIGSSNSEFILVVNGPNLDTIKAGSDMIVQSLQEVPGLADVRSTADGEKPEIVLRIDENKLAEYGLYPGMVGLNLRSMISGESITTVEMDGKTTDLIFGLNMDEISSLEELGEQSIPNVLGEPVKLNEIATLENTKIPVSIARLNQKEYVMIQGTITSANSGEVISKATEIMNGLDLPQGVTWYKEGASEAMAEGFTNMGIALSISILLVYLVMIIAFGEATAPFVILFAIPFSAIGALLGLFVVNEPIGMPAMVGLLMLNGIVVTNAIVLIDRVKQNERLGMNKLEALLEAGVTRIRPILMTAIATMGALGPLAFTTSGGLLSRSLAVVVIGGLATSTALTLIIVPVLYSLMHRDQNVQEEISQGEAAQI